MRIAFCAVVLAVLAAGCGSNSSSVGDASPPPPTTTVTVTTTQAEPSESTTTTAAAKSLALRVYFLAPDGKLVAVSRDVEQTQAPGAATLRELTEAPGGMTTEVPAGLELTIDEG